MCAAYTTCTTCVHALHTLQESIEPPITPVKGWLMKQGGRRTGRKWGWRKRWFVLPIEGDQLAYFTSATAPRPKDIVPLATP